MRNLDKSALKDFYEHQAEQRPIQTLLYESGDNHSVAFHNKRLQTIAYWFDKIKNERVVRTFGDIGTAEGLYLKIAKETFSQQFLAVGTDIALNYLKKARTRTRCEVVLCDAEQLPLKDNSLDVVLCTEVLEHLPSPQKAFCELDRISRGFILLSFPGDSVVSRIYGLFSREWKRKNAESDHISEITIKQVRHWAESSNLKVRGLALSGALGTVIPQFLRLPLFLYRGLDNSVSWLFQKARLYELATTKIMLLEKRL